MLKAIIFDVDGVMFNSKDSEGKYLWSKNIKTDLGITSMHFKRIFSQIWDDITRGKIDTKDHLSKVLAHFPELRIKADDLIKYWHENDSFIDERMTVLLTRECLNLQRE